MNAIPACSGIQCIERRFIQVLAFAFDGSDVNKTPKCILDINMRKDFINKCSISSVLVQIMLLFSFQVYANEKHPEEREPVTAGDTVMSSAELLNTYWKLIELESNPIVTQEDQREMKLTLNIEENQVNGFGGCNSFFGSFTHDANSITFGPLAATRMFCADSMEQEDQFFKSLSEIVSYQITGQILILKDNQEMPRLKLEAVYLK